MSEVVGAFAAVRPGYWTTEHERADRYAALIPPNANACNPPLCTRVHTSALPKFAHESGAGIYCSFSQCQVLLWPNLRVSPVQNDASKSPRRRVFVLLFPDCADVCTVIYA